MPKFVLIGLGVIALGAIALYVMYRMWYVDRTLEHQQEMREQERVDAIWENDDPETIGEDYIDRELRRERDDE